MFILPTSLGLTGEKYIGNVLPILLQYLYRMLRFFPRLLDLFPRGIIYESAKTNVIKSFLYYILFTNVVSSLWYFSGIQRVNQCLQEACHLANEPKCTTLMNCNSQWQNISATWSSDNGANNCLSDKSSFSYGIFSRIVPIATETSGVMNKYVNAIFWGLQQLANYARNLSPSHFVWEIRFTWFITVVGLFLYGHLIYNTQKFLYIFYQRMQEMHLRRRYVD
ncbi:probable cyclic nucleotide-gated ion channel 20, chloroplastic [Vicia villosa]|uniref:probable cyclic nucleotide-gated ion channel 20, chloroplastic n=1 Tax=Vicia villosa TaxID=3911 RepID=UPI00273C69E5|nr:probable cyclic nucleotide-gated ion channel 20, chloroplastic [Vicia villosa]